MTKGPGQPRPGPQLPWHLTTSPNRSTLTTAFRQTTAGQRSKSKMNIDVASQACGISDDR